MDHLVATPTPLLQQIHSPLKLQLQVRQEVDTLVNQVITTPCLATAALALTVVGTI